MCIVGSVCVVGGVCVVGSVSVLCVCCGQLCVLWVVCVVCICVVYACDECIVLGREKEREGKKRGWGKRTFSTS